MTFVDVVTHKNKDNNNYAPHPRQSLGELLIKIRDLYGKLISTRIVKNTEMYINLSNFSKGIYIVAITKKDEIVTIEKIIKK